MAHAQQHEEEEERCSQDPMTGRKGYDDLIASLPADDGGWGHRLRRYRHFWYRRSTSRHALHQRHIPSPTVGRRPRHPAKVRHHTWLKSLAFSILHRRLHPPSAPDHPLLTSNPHQCVPFLDSYYDDETLRPDVALDSLPPPRLIAMHQSYSALPDSVTGSGCKIVYLARDPKDTLVSRYHFVGTARTGMYERGSFDQAFERFCSGVSFAGPIWEHQLEYWRESLRQPERVMFLKYEDLMADAASHVKTLAEFMGCPFEEDEAGVAEEIVRLCSFDNLSTARVNIEGDQVVYPKAGVRIQNSGFFRKGKVGDWRNHMSPEMAMRLDAIAEEKFAGSGLCFPSG